MTRLTFLLSGEHPSLPQAEIYGAIEAEGYTFKRDEELDQVLTLETDAPPVKIAERLGMSHWIGRHACTSDISQTFDAVENSGITDMLPGGKKIAVKVTRVKKYSPEIDAPKFSKDIADAVTTSGSFKIDLSNPDAEILGILTEDKCVVGVTGAWVERKQYEKRRPKKRAVFHPGTLMPTLGRAMVNLARTPRGGTLLDPFCGVGGIMVEAGLIGAKPIGIDINLKMLPGAEENLKQAGVTNYSISAGDARHLNPSERVDAIATDPPYGRQATTAGSDLEKLYEAALPRLATALKPGGYMCITAAGLEISDIAESAGLEILERHEQRVHKSLTRTVYVFRRR